MHGKHYILKQRKNRPPVMIRMFVLLQDLAGLSAAGLGSCSSDLRSPESEPAAATVPTPQIPAVSVVARLAVSGESCRLPVVVGYAARAASLTKVYPKCRVQA